MPELIPFRCFYYRNGTNGEELKDLVSPPYDVISKEERNFCIDKSPDNICHVILPDEYEEAGRKLNEMIESKTLIADKERCLCIYGIDYIKPDTKETISRYGFVGLLKLVEIFPARDGVIPHERTFQKFTQDRLQIIRQTDANFSPIFTIYNGNGSAEKIFQKFINTRPFLQTLDRDGFTHKIWKVCETEDIAEIQEIVKEHPVIIADGHHRYITSLRRSREGGCKYIMSLFIDFNDPGLIIYTSHRQIHNMPVKSIEELKNKVKDNFEVVGHFKDLDMWKRCMEDNKGKHVFGCYFQEEFIVFKLKNKIKPIELIPGKNSTECKQLNLTILHHILLKGSLGIEEKDISYIKGIKNGVKSVDTNEDIEALFIVNPTTLEEVHKITALGELMPQKSTYFYPKPLSGLIVHQHTDLIE